MDYWKTSFVLSGALVYVVTAHLYIFVSTPLTWEGAQSVCRESFLDLATAESTADISAIIRTGSTYADDAWIGLHDDLVKNWIWSLRDNSFYAEGETDFRNWNDTEPNNLGGSDLCVEIVGNPYLGQWNDENCNSQRQSVCYNGTVNNTASFVKVDTLSNWTEAQRFCRENYVDLASVRNQMENDIITSLTNVSVWIGLHRETLWSDGSPSLFRYWANGQPAGAACVSIAINDSGRWSEEDCSLSFPFICSLRNSAFKAIGQDETSITLQWEQVSTNVSFVVTFNGTERNISQPIGDGPVNHTVSSLTAGTKYTFTLFSVFESVRSSGVNTTAVTAPPNTDSFKSIGQDETSITLQWNQVNTNVSFVLMFDGTERNISQPIGDGPVTYTVSSLTAGTKYTFTLFSEFESVRSSGVNTTAVTAPPNTDSFKPIRQNETSITLQWNQVNTVVSFVLILDGTERNIIIQPIGEGPVTHTVSSLTAGTKYTFTLFSVFESVRSSGVNTTAVTGPYYVVGMKFRLKSFTQLSDLDIQDLLTEFFKQQGVPPPFSLKISPFIHWLVDERLH